MHRSSSAVTAPLPVPSCQFRSMDYTTGETSMNFPRLRRVVVPLVFGALLLGAGCSNPFIPKYKVLVDSISSPEAKKPTGQSYRLVARPALVSQVPMQVPVVYACVNTALTGIGMFEAPPGIPSDLVIELSFGSDASPRVESV